MQWVSCRSLQVSNRTGLDTKKYQHRNPGFESPSCTNATHPFGVRFYFTITLFFLKERSSPAAPICAVAYQSIRGNEKWRTGRLFQVKPFCTPFF